MFKFPVLLYGLASIISYGIARIVHFTPLQTIDDNVLALGTVVTSILVVLGTIITLIIQLRTGSVKELKDIIEELKLEVSSVKAENVKLRDENDALRFEFSKFQAAMKKTKVTKRRPPKKSR